MDVAVVGGDWQRRDSAWFDSLFRSHFAVVLQYARRRVSAADADDVVAEVFAVAWRRRHEVHDMNRLWLLRTASYLVQHSHRGVARRDRLIQRVGEAQQVRPGPTSDDGDQDLLAALSELSTKDQEILRLSAWEQLEPGELAIVLGCSVAAVRVRLHRARRRLAQRVTGPAFADASELERE